jgi:hypothetical protein
VRAGEGEGNKAVSMRGSPGTVGGGEVVQRRLELGTCAGEGGRELKNEGKRCEVAGGGARPFIGPRGTREAVTGAVTVDINGLHH